MPVSPAASPVSYRPPGRLDIATALAPYAGAWGTRQAAHLLRRAGFGGSPDDVARAAAGSMPAAVDRLVRFGPVPPAERPDLRPDTPLAVRQQMIAEALPLAEIQKRLGGARRANAIAMFGWFLGRMIGSPAPLQEKMTLFWHGHFTSAYEKGIPAQALLDQNELFRRNALGNVRELTLAVAQDPAMLRYLDNVQNVKAHPNENFARELMELFTLGIGNYTESDVRESARAFTGWGFDRNWAFASNPRVHDTGTKTFLGRSGDFDGRDIVGIIFEQPAAARRFAAKLLNFFVYSDPEPELIGALADQLRAHDYQLAPVMAMLLGSNVFYSERAYRALVKSPVEYVVGAHQLFGLPAVDLGGLDALRRMGQVLFYPPNVKGWDGGASWINSQAMLTRANFASTLMARAAAAPWMAAAVRRPDPVPVASALSATILQGDVSPAALERLVAYLGGSDQSALGMLSGEIAEERVRGAAYLTMAMPAYQLA